MFHCFRPSGGCEWFGGELAGFVRHFNAKNGTTYELDRCLDVRKGGRQQPEPEVLVRSDNSIETMVIERKMFVWPKDYLKQHRDEHVFSERIQSRLKDLFQDDLYMLRVDASSLREAGKRKDEILTNADQITDLVTRNRSKLTQLKGIKSTLPFQWSFGHARDEERSDDAPERGVGIEINDGMSFFGGVGWSEYQKSCEEIPAEVTRLLEAADRKFVNYPTSLKVVLMELVGEFEFGDDIKRIIAEANLPPRVDQVWVAEPGHNDDFEPEMTYTQIR